MKYTISAGQYDGLLDMRRERKQSSLRAALRSLRSIFYTGRVRAMPLTTLLGFYVYVELLGIAHPEPKDVTKFIEEFVKAGTEIMIQKLANMRINK